jgi:sphinganine-1-phosphate aldolase
MCACVAAVRCGRARCGRGIEAIEGLHIVGKPKAMILAFASRDFSIYALGDKMSHDKGWSLNALQKPACLHICVTLRHVLHAQKFLDDLSQCMAEVRAEPAGKKDGNAAIYGMASSLPAGPVKHMPTSYTNIVLKP